MATERMGKVLHLAAFLLDSRRDIEVFGMFGAGNLGDEAMLVAARDSLPAGRVIGCKTRSRYPLLDRLLKARPRPHLLVAGGTLIHGGNTGWLDYIEHRAAQGVQVAFFGTGIAFNEDQCTPSYPPYRRWSHLLAASPQVHLRGPASVALAERMGTRADVFGDFAFLLYDPTRVLANHANRKPVIGLNFGHCGGDQEIFEAAAARLVGRIPTEYRLAFHVVVSSDNAPTQRIIAAAGLPAERYVIERHYYDPHSFMASVRDYRAFFGLKLHAAGLAMIAGVPSLMVAYLPKCRDFMAPLGGREDLLVDLPLDVEEVMSKLDMLLAQPARGSVEREIARYADRQRQMLARAYA